MQRFGKTPAEVADSQGNSKTADAIRSFVPRMILQVQRLLRWRRAVEAKRDAAMVFRAAAEGRPMELAERVRLGKLADGLSTLCPVSNADSLLALVESNRD